MILTTKHRRELMERAKAASESPWTVADFGNEIVCIERTGATVAVTHHMEHANPDAAFIAAANPAAVLALLGERDRLVDVILHMKICRTCGEEIPERDCPGARALWIAAGLPCGMCGRRLVNDDGPTDDETCCVGYDSVECEMFCHARRKARAALAEELKP